MRLSCHFLIVRCLKIELVQVTFLLFSFYHFLEVLDVDL